MGRVSRPSSRVRIGGVWITPCLTTVEAAGAVAAVAECVVADGDFASGDAVAAVAVAAEPVG